MYKACILDMDGTIINTLNSLAYFGNQALAAFNLPPIEPERYKKMVGNGVYTLIERVLTHAGGEVTPENTANLYKAYTKLYESDPLYLVTPYEGVTELLQQLKAAGCKLAVLSNKPHNMTNFIAEKFFPGLFDHVQGQQDDCPVKPDPTALLSILETLQVTKEEVLYCGDSDVDMQTAKNAGTASAGAEWGFRGREELIANGADYIAAKPLDLYEIVMQTQKSLSMRIV